MTTALKKIAEWHKTASVAERTSVARSCGTTAGYLRHVVSGRRHARAELILNLALVISKGGSTITCPTCETDLEVL